GEGAHPCEDSSRRWVHQDPSIVDAVWPWHHCRQTRWPVLIQDGCGAADKDVRPAPRSAGSQYHIGVRLGLLLPKGPTGFDSVRYVAAEWVLVGNDRKHPQFWIPGCAARRRRILIQQPRCHQFVLENRWLGQGRNRYHGADPPGKRHR